MRAKIPGIDFADCIVLLSALRVDQPRAIDWYINYFGDAPGHERRMSRTA
jgi:hypothetical protein